MPQNQDFVDFLSSSDVLEELLSLGRVDYLLGYRVKQRGESTTSGTAISLRGLIELLDPHGNVRNVQPATPREVEMYQLLTALVSAVRKHPGMSTHLADDAVA